MGRDVDYIFRPQCEQLDLLQAIFCPLVMVVVRIMVSVSVNVNRVGVRMAN